MLASKTGIPEIQVIKNSKIYHRVYEKLFNFIKTENVTLKYPDIEYVFSGGFTLQPYLEFPDSKSKI